MSRADAIAKLDAVGIDSVCEDISDGCSLTSIAIKANVSIGSLLAWLEAMPERSSRAREARTAMAKLWDERAEAIILNAGEEFDLKKAKELAHHYRWRASKIAPREYGDKLELAGDAERPLTVTINRLTDAPK